VPRKATLLPNSRPAVVVPPDRKILLTVEEAAALLNLGRNAVYALTQNGELPAIKHGTRTLIHRRAVNRYANRRMDEAEAFYAVSGKAAS